MRREESVEFYDGLVGMKPAVYRPQHDTNILRRGLRHAGSDLACTVVLVHHTHSCGMLPRARRNNVR